MCDLPPGRSVSGGLRSEPCQNAPETWEYFTFDVVRRDRYRSLWGFAPVRDLTSVRLAVILTVSAGRWRGRLGRRDTTMTDATTYTMTVENDFMFSGRIDKELTLVEVGKYLAVLAGEQGKPTTETLTVVAGPRKGQKVAVFVFGRGQSVQAQKVAVYGTTAEAIRGAYRAFLNNQMETCERCGGSGVYYGAGHVENGKFVGYSGECFRCKGKGEVTHYQNVLGAKGIGEYAMRSWIAEVEAAKRSGGNLGRGSGRCSCSEGHTCDNCARYWRGSDYDHPDFDGGYEPNEDALYESYMDRWASDQMAKEESFARY